jgi:hypothetical protein
VKTSRHLGDRFHFSANQYASAEEYGDRYAIVRVIYPESGDPKIYLLFDLVALSREADPRVSLMPESFSGRTRMPAEGVRRQVSLQRHRSGEDG